MKKNNDYRILFDRVKQWHDEMSMYVIDIGCRDIKTSNVRPFIEADCRALLIEPNPKQADHIEKEMFNEYKEYLHNLDLLQIAIAEKDGIIDFIVSPDAGHSRIPNENFDKNKWQTKGQKNIKVSCWSFQTLLDKYPEFADASLIDIDTEGYDTIVLRSILSTTARPMFIMIEHWGDSKIFAAQWELFTKHHYVEIGIEVNQSSLWKLTL